MIQDIKKEMRYGFRNSRFLILAVGFLFFALSTPVMLKLLPEILKSQYPNMSPEAFGALVDMTQKGAIQSYMQDVFEIGTIIVTFTLCGVIAQELRENTLILPVCSGKSYGGITAAKMVVFGLSLMIILTVALLSDYAYAGMLLGFEFSVWPVLRGGLLEGFYMVFLLSGLMMFGSFIRKPIAAGIVTLVLAYGTNYLGSLLKIGQYLPSGLLTEAGALAAQTSSTLWLTLLITAGAIVLFCAVTVQRLKTMELSAK